MEAPALSIIDRCNELETRIDEFLRTVFSRFLSVTDDALRGLDVVPLHSLVSRFGSNNSIRDLETRFDADSLELLNECDSIDYEIKSLKFQLQDFKTESEQHHKIPNTKLIEGLEMKKASLLQIIQDKNAVLGKLVRLLVPIYIHMISMKQESGTSRIHSHEFVDSPSSNNRSPQSHFPISEVLLESASETIGSVSSDCPSTTPLIPSDDVFFS